MNSSEAREPQASDIADIMSIYVDQPNRTPYVAYDDETKDALFPEPADAATVKYYTGGSRQLFGSYPDTCDIEETMLYADQSNGHLYFTYSDCDSQMTVKVN